MKIHFEQIRSGYTPKENCIDYIIESKEFVNFIVRGYDFPQDKILYTVINGEVKEVFFVNISDETIWGVLMDENGESLEERNVLTFTEKRDAELFAAAKNELENICSYIDEEVEIYDKMINELKRKKEEALEEKKEYKNIHMKLNEI